MAGLFSTKKNRKRITVIGIVICFVVSFLPVTNSWYLSLNGRTDLSHLVISAIAVKNLLDKKSSEKKLARSLDNMFKELKFATGMIKPAQAPEKKGVYLAQINPEYPVRNLISILSAYQDFFSLVPCKNVFFQTLFFPPELPPPEGLFVS